MIDFRAMDGSEARAIDPEGVQWPDGAIVLYAVEDEEIVGRQAYLLFPHLEGAWVRGDKRGTSLAFRLVREMEKTVAETGYPAVFAYALDTHPEVAGYLERMGYSKLPLTVWTKPVSVEKEASA